MGAFTQEVDDAVPLTSQAMAEVGDGHSMDFTTWTGCHERELVAPLQGSSKTQGDVLKQEAEVLEIRAGVSKRSQSDAGHMSGSDRNSTDINSDNCKTVVNLSRNRK